MPDVVVVGAGATGAWAARHLARRGLSVLVLEAGPERRLGEDIHAGVYAPIPPVAGAATPPRQPVQSRHPAFNLANAHLFVDDVEQPYESPPDRPFDWIRGEQIGGRTLTWARVTLRMSRHELEGTRVDDARGEWPIGYDDLAPWYDAAEEVLGTWGGSEDLDVLPRGRTLGCVPLTPAEERFRAAVSARWPDRHVVGMRGVPLPASFDAWPTFTAQAMLADAIASGRCTLRSGAAVRRIVRDDSEGLARAVEWVDVATGETHEATAKVVLSCASTIGTLRLLLASGLGDENDLLGRGLMDHVSFAAMGSAPDAPLSPLPPFGGPHGIFVPRFRNVHERRRDYVGGFAYWGAIGRVFPGSKFLVVAYGEVLPALASRVTLDRTRSDAFGRPLPKIELAWSSNEHAMMADARETLLEMLDHTQLSVDRIAPELQVPGRFVHETGGAPMGVDPRTSVVDRYNRLWCAPNVLVTDGACFPRCGYQNPTLTMLAITARACAALVDRLAKGEQRVWSAG